MTAISGNVEAMGTKEVKTRFGMKPTYSIKVDGEWYKCGFKKPRCGKGDNVTFTFTEGTYGKEVDGEVSSSGGGVEARAPSTPAVASGRHGGFPIGPLDGQRSIIRQNCQTNARELYMHFNPEPAMPISAIVDEIILLARKFEAYSCGDLDATRAKEITKAKTKPAAPTMEDVLGETE